MASPIVSAPLNVHRFEQVKLPEYFDSKKVDEVAFKQFILMKLGIPKISNPNAQDLKRFEQAKERMLSSAWNDYERTCKILAEERFTPITHKEFSSGQLEKKLSSFLANAHMYIFKLNEDGSIRGEALDLIPLAHAQVRESKSFIEEHSSQERAKASIDLPIWKISTDQPCEIFGTPLMVDISNTASLHAVRLIKLGADLNKYAPLFGNTALLLSIAKGWCHVNQGLDQNSIIRRLLASGKIEPNVIDLKTGMTPLHFAALRGDDVELIELLLKAGADPTLKDYEGKTPEDYLSETYETMKKKMASILGEKFGHYGMVLSVDIPRMPENKSNVGTIPTGPERRENIVKIRQLLSLQSKPASD